MSARLRRCLAIFPRDSACRGVASEQCCHLETENNDNFESVKLNVRIAWWPMLENFLKSIRLNSYLYISTVIESFWFAYLCKFCQNTEASNEISNVDRFLSFFKKKEIIMIK